MADLQPTDTLLVNRAGIDYSVAQADVMATVQDTDLLLINRAGVDYNATYADVKKGFGPQHINPAPGDWTFNPAIVSGTGTQADPYVITPATVNTPGGTAQSAQTLTLTGLTPNDLVEWTDHSVGAGNRFHQLLGLVPPSGQVDLKLNYVDTPASTTGQTFTGDLQIGTTYFRWVVTQVATKAPDIDTVTLSDVAGGDRFTSTAFPVSATMTEDGVPTSTKKLKAYVEGALSRQPVSSAITQVNGLVLTLTDDTDLANFAPGDAVTELGGGDDATGTVGSVDTGANTITLSASAGTWDVGSQVLGPSKVITVTPESDEIVGVAADTPAVGETTLTLASDKDLVNFAPGDAVDQDSAYAPNSDVITAIAADTPAVGQSTLTLASDQDLENFAPGDLVLQDNTTIQPITRIYSDGIGAPTSGGWSPGANGNPFDGVDNNITSLKLTNGPGGYTVTFTPPLTGVTSFSARGGSYLPGEPFTLTLSDGAESNTGNFTTQPNYDAPANLDALVPASGVVSSVTIDCTVNGSGFVSMRMNNILLVDGDTFNGPSPSGTVGSVDTGANTITLISSTGAWSANTGNYVIGPSKTASGTVGSVDPAGPTITLSSSTGTWAANAGKYVIGPTKPSSSVKLYCKLDAAGAVSDLQSADPGFTAWTPAGASPGPYTGNITWPAVLPTGNDPDTDLPAGTSLTVEVEASNTAGTDSAKSNTITPA